MSDMGFSLHQTQPNAGAAWPREPRAGGMSLLQALSQPTGFRPDSRFGMAAIPVPVPDLDIPAPQPDGPDPMAEAYAQGYAEGHAVAADEAHAQMLADSVARVQLALAFDRIDDRMQEDLRMRLRETVMALCETVLAPLAVDEDALVQRIGRAAAMLARADDERVIRLHPSDIALISERMRADWEIMPDGTLERGAVRVEGRNGGVEDGPATWRLAIAEALDRG